DNLHRQFVGQLARKAQQAFVAVFLDPAAGAGERRFDEFPLRVEFAQRSIAVERVEGRLGRQLPVAAGHFPTIFAAPDGFAEVADLPEPVADGRRAVRKFGDDVEAVRLVVELAQANGLEPARPDGEFDVAADFIAPAIVDLSAGPDLVRLARRGPLADLVIVVADERILAV